MPFSQLFVANWKMNMLIRDAAQYVLELRRLYRTSATGQNDVVLAPPFTLLASVREQIGGVPGVLLAAQNIHWDDFGAHTGEISAPMLREFGVSYAIVGHSERRQKYGETDQAVAMRAHHALKHGITPIICIGETLAEFEAGETRNVLTRQLETAVRPLNEEEVRSIVLAYEPAWAIGTGRVATIEIVTEASRFIHGMLDKKFSEPGTRLLYGGSTTGDNIGEIMRVEGICGALVGGASLKAESFWALVENGRAAGESD